MTTRHVRHDDSSCQTINKTKTKKKKQRRSCVRNDAYELWTANNIKDRKQLTNLILNEEKKNSISWLCWCSSLIDATFWVYTLLFCEETIRSFHRDNSKYLFAPALQTTHKIEICVVRMIWGSRKYEVRASTFFRGMSIFDLFSTERIK